MNMNDGDNMFIQGIYLQFNLWQWNLYPEYTYTNLNSGI